MPTCFASNLTRGFSKSEVLPGEEIAVNYSIDPPNSKFWAVDEIIPNGWRVKEAQVYKGHLRWYVTQTPFKTYTLIAPNEKGIYNFSKGSYQTYGDDNWYNFDPVRIEVIESHSPQSPGGGDGGSSLEEKACIESWTCTDWIPIVCPSTSRQTRTCADRSNCGTEANKPNEIRVCFHYVPEEKEEKEALKEAEPIPEIPTAAPKEAPPPSKPGMLAITGAAIAAYRQIPLTMIVLTLFILLIIALFIYYHKRNLGCCSFHFKFKRKK